MNYPVSVHLWVKFSFEMHFKGILEKKRKKIFLWSASFVC